MTHLLYKAWGRVSLCHVGQMLSVFLRRFLQWNHWWCLFTSPSLITQSSNRSEQWHCVSWKHLLACVQADRESGIDRWILIFLFLSLNNAVQEAALFWCNGLHVNWESMIWDILGSGGREVTPHPSEEGGKGNYPSQHQQREGNKVGFPRAGWVKTCRKEEYLNCICVF